MPNTHKLTIKYMGEWQPNDDHVRPTKQWHQNDKMTCFLNNKPMKQKR
jgi:hypothetical protein